MAKNLEADALRTLSQFYENQNAELKRELQNIRQSFFDILTDDIREIFNGYVRIDTAKDAYAWEHEVIKIIIDMAEVEPLEKKVWDDLPRAKCPLCRQAPTTAWESVQLEGFAVPEGLKRHLEGYGKVQQCVVTKNIFKYIYNYWEPMIKEDRDKKEKKLIDRRKNETLYNVDPTDEPCLIDEGILYYGNIRDSKGLKWAVDRLINLGFKTKKDGNLVSYEKDMGDYVIFGDPRNCDRLNFKICIKPNTSKNKNKKEFKRVVLRTNIYILDTWKNDLKKKVEQRFFKAIEQ